MARRHHIMPSREAEWTGYGRVWAHVQQFDPRRGTLRGHILAAFVGLAGAAMLLGLGL